MTDHVKVTIDGVSFVVTLGAIAQWLPAVAAVFSIVWTAIRIYETKTVQRFLKRINNEQTCN